MATPDIPTFTPESISPTTGPSVVPTSTADLSAATGDRIVAIGKGILPTVGALAHLGILWIGMKMIVTGKRPKILGGK